MTMKGCPRVINDAATAFFFFMRYNQDMNENESRVLAAKHIFVRGIVQGIGFRAWTASLAREYAIKGWVRNAPDYSVEIFAEGFSANLDSFVGFLKTGHPYARVDEVECTNVPIQNSASFTVVR